MQDKLQELLDRLDANLEDFRKTWEASDKAKLIDGSREITAMKAGLESARASIRLLEISEARTAERYNSIISNFDEMKSNLNELSELLRENQNRGDQK